MSKQREMFADDLRGMSKPLTGTARFASEGVESRYERLKSLLDDGDWHGVAELINAAGHRFGAYLFDLRHEGLTIEKRVVARNVYQYRWAR